MSQFVERPVKRMQISFTTPSAPRTKKNSGRIVYISKGGVRTPRFMPSIAFRDWNKTAQVWLSVNARPKLAREYPAGIAFEVNCRALFYRDALRGDAVGFYQALADALEEN